jgi:hypothetical protein
LLLRVEVLRFFRPDQSLIHRWMEEHSLLNHPSSRRSNFQHFHCDISNFHYDISNFHCFKMTICWIVIISN